LYDAWGAIVKMQDGAGVSIERSKMLLDRGYTGHEHLLSVGLIHMNGRLYDPKLHRFLQPDNYVQDPSNTQNYNRYGYVLNNPLIYTDPSGEECPECPKNPWIEINPNPYVQPYNVNKPDPKIKTPKEILEEKITKWYKDKVSLNSLFHNSWIGDATNWVVGGIASLFGNGSSKPPVAQAANVKQVFNNIAQQATVFAANYAGAIVANNITFGIKQLPYAQTGTKFEGAERLGRFFGDITTITQGVLEDGGAVAAEVFTLGGATVPAGAVAIHGTAVAAGSFGAALKEGLALVDYFGKSKGGSSESSDYGREAEHTKGARPSTKIKHEKGLTRKGRDKGGEKGDTRRRRYK
jgi:RHS repeat-associated protein